MSSDSQNPTPAEGRAPDDNTFALRIAFAYRIGEAQSCQLAVTEPREEGDEVLEAEGDPSATPG